MLMWLKLITSQQGCPWFFFFFLNELQDMDRHSKRFLDKLEDLHSRCLNTRLSEVPVLKC